jgi:hypothetical protein
MDTRQEHGEPERRESLGGRVRRFVDSELSRVLDKDEGPEADQKPVSTSVDAPGPASHPAATTPVDPGYDTPGYGPSASHPRAEETELGEFSDRANEEAAADSSAERVGLLDDPAGLRAQWQQVQGTFVDDPQRAVQEASALVSRTLNEIHENVSRGQASDPTSTEDLRVSFQRYREFFHRLLSA